MQIYVFTDFYCPFCARAAAVLQEERRKHPGRVAVTVIHRPLTRIHVNARAAAIAAECAGVQGRFEEYHDNLFRDTNARTTLDWEGVARRSMVPDIPAFVRCVDRQESSAKVSADERLADEIGVTGTPTFVVNGAVSRGLRPQALASLIDTLTERGPALTPAALH